jgi:hypothetical protein
LWSDRKIPAASASIFRIPFSHSEDGNLYSSPSIIRIIKSRRMRWAAHVARVGEKRNAYRICRKARRKETTGMTKA